MKKILYTLLLVSFISFASAQFTTGNIVVLTAGNGGTPLSTAAFPATLVEYNTSGTTTGYSVSLPSTGTGNVLTISGTTGQEGQLTLSPDGLFLAYAGYDVTFGTTGNVSSSTSNRSVGYTSNNGTNTITSAAVFSAQNSRGAVTDGCGNIWAASAGSANGFYYWGNNHTSGGGPVSTSPATSIRAVGLFNNQLYFSTQSVTYGVYKVDSTGGYGIPTTGPVTASSLIASPAGASANSTTLPYGFFFNAASTICYVADGRNTADSTAGNGCKVTSGGIERFNFTGGVWKFAYTLPVSANGVAGAAYLTVDFSGANPIIYAVTAEASADHLVKITDNGNTANYTTLATAPANDLFKGVAFSPSAVATPTQDNNITFSSVTAGTLTASWTNNGGAGHEVFLNTANSFTAPSGIPGTGNPSYSGSGSQLVYSGTGNTVNITGLSPNTTYYFEVYAYNQNNCTYQYNTTTATNNPNSVTTTPTPGLFVSPASLAFASVAVNQTYELSYTLSGIGLSNAVTVSAPSGYGVSTTSGGPYSASISIPESGGNANATIYVGFSPTTAVSYPGNITNVSGIYSQNVGLTGTGVNPAISVSGTVAFGNQNINTTTLPQSFNVSGTNLVSSVTVTAPAGYQVSQSPCSGYGTTTVITVTNSGTPQGGTLASTPVYVEFTPTSNGSYNNNNAVTATGAVTVNEAVTGRGVTLTGFGNNNLAVLVVGDGCSALTSSATVGSLFEFTPSGTATGYQFALPSASGSSQITFSGSATYDGPISRSVDSLLLVVGGYHAAAGTASVTSGTNARAVSTVMQNGTYGEVTSSTLLAAGNCRQAASDGCNNYWVSGNLSGSGGVAYFGSASAAAYAQTTSTNDRGLMLQNGNLYFSTTTTTPGVYSLGASPVTPTTPTLVINTNTGTSGTASSPSGFIFNTAGTVCYIADDRNTADSTTGLTVESGGVQKWTLVSGVWKYQYTLPVSANGVAGARWLTVDFGSTNPVIYATSGETANNRIVSITDNGVWNNSAYNTLSTSGTNYIYRGITFTPKTMVAAPTTQDNSIHFTAITGGAMTVSWTNGNGSGHLVRIDTANLFTHPKFDSTYAGEISTVYTGNGQQAVYSGTGNSVTITGLTAGNTYWIRVYGYNTENCSIAYDTTIAVDNPIPNINSWTGTTNTSWAVGTNWSTGVPPNNSCSANVLIPAGTPNSPILSAATSIGDVTILDGATLTLNANLSVCGDWTGGTSSNAIVTGTGILNLNGTTAAQKINGHTQFQEILLNNSNGAQMQTGSSVDVYTALDLQSGTFTTNGALTFKSTSVSQAAIINNFSSGYAGTLTGNVIAERYYLAATYYTQQHEMGSPVNTPSLSQFGDVSASGNYVIPNSSCSEIQLASNSPYGRVFGYNENAPGVSTCAMAGWYVEPASGTATNGVGYSILNAGPATLQLTGTPNLATSYTVSNLSNHGWHNTTAQNHTIYAGWQLVANPYLATLNISSAPTGFDNQILVWRANGTGAGSYETLMAGSNAVIAPFQAFLVHVSANNSGPFTYTIKATDRTVSPQTFYMQNDNQLDIVAENTGTGLLDKTTVAFNTNATDTFDTQFDANKSAGALNRHTIYSVNNGYWMSINTLRDIGSAGTVPVGFEPGASGNYSFTFGNLNTFDPTTYIYLEDLQQHIMYNIRSGNYLFTADSADDWSRFVLHFSPAIVINTIDAGCNSLGNININQPGTANWNYTLTDGSNTIISTGVINQNSPLNIYAPAGTYTLTLVDNNNYTVTKVIQLSGSQLVAASFSPSVNTVATQTEISFVNTSQNANAYSWNFGDGTTSSLVSPIHTYAAPGTYTVELNVTNTTGCTSTANETIRVINTTTAITNVSDNGISMWSNANRIYIDFSQLSSVDAKIRVYDILGQELLNDEFTTNALYQKEIDNTNAACVIVSVKNNGEIITKKLFLINTK